METIEAVPDPRPEQDRTETKPGVGCQDDSNSGLFSLLYEHLFHKPEFENWHSSRCNFQLRYFGGPGSGKVRPGAHDHLVLVFISSKIRAGILQDWRGHKRADFHPND